MNRWVMVVSLALAISILGMPALSNAQQVTFRVGDPYRGTSLTFSTAPRMVRIQDTPVYTVRGENDRNLYRYGNTWYYIEDGNWYRASSWQGPFVYVRGSMVPEAVLTIPTTYRTTWYSNDRWHDGDRWRDRDFYSYRDTYGYRRYPVRITTMPRMSWVPGTHVLYSTADADYDLYRYGDSYFLVDNGRWYRSYSWRGPFYSVSRRYVPSAVLTIPPSYRRNWTATVDYGTGQRTTYHASRPYQGVTFSTRPSMAFDPGARVYYNRDQSDYDLFEYANSWYLEDNGVWYRADSWRGPFYTITEDDLPNPVIDMWQNQQ